MMPDYDVSKNYYKVKVGLSLPEWEEKRWIHPQDPRGWIEFKEIKRIKNKKKENDKY